jgi:hypothetical protein
LSINLESLPIGQIVFVGNQAEREAKILKSLKKLFDIRPKAKPMNMENIAGNIT